jgi:hypothetical protein
MIKMYNAIYIMSSNINYVDLPFTYTITDICSNSVVYIPAFPGAYFYNIYPATTQGSFFPVYTSIADFSTNLFVPLINDVDKQVVVLPGYSLEMYTNSNYGTLVYSLDNSGGTDYRMSVAPTINTASSCKLYYTPSSTGVKYLLPYRSNPTPIITGGTSSYVTVSGISYAVFTFTTTGTMTINYISSSVSNSSFTAQVLLVAGGGSGGTANSLYDCAGGGGAGGVAIGSITLSKNTTYTFTVGAGATTSATNGANSSITNPSSQSLLVYGGGAGARNTAAGNGGSGGGATANSGNHLNKGSPLTGTNTIGATVTFYGYAGGTSRASGGASAGGGGGGGAGAVGGNGGAGGNTDQAGAGGNGTTWTFNNTVYGGGGGGGQASNGYIKPPGGTGGGGSGSRMNGTVEPATSGTHGLGGGGGGGYGAEFGTGGNGIIIIAIKMSDLN